MDSSSTRTQAELRAAYQLLQKMDLTPESYYLILLDLAVDWIAHGDKDMATNLVAEIDSDFINRSLALRLEHDPSLVEKLVPLAEALEAPVSTAEDASIDLLLMDPVVAKA